MILFGAGWIEMGILGRKERDGAMAFQVKENKKIVHINQCQNHFLTADEMHRKKYIFGHSLVYVGRRQAAM